jgi:hypothetical protein
MLKYHPFSAGSYSCICKYRSIIVVNMVHIVCVILTDTKTPIFLRPARLMMVASIVGISYMRSCFADILSLCHSSRKR